MINIALVGSGWRAETYIKIIKELDSFFSLTAVLTKTKQKQDYLKKKYNVKIIDDYNELKNLKVDFVICCVTKSANYSTTKAITEYGIPVLCETPCGTSEIERLNFINLAKTNKIQIAEQYHLQPMIASIINIVKNNYLGNINSVYISCCHNYHAIHVIRKILGTETEMPEIYCYENNDAFIEDNYRDNFFDPKLKDHKRITAILKFKNKNAIYDFSSGQYFSKLRAPRIIVRGSLGECDFYGGSYFNSTDFHNFKFIRNENGCGSNLYDKSLVNIEFNGKIIYKNNFFNYRLSDEQIAIANVMLSMYDYVKYNKPFYSVNEAVIDSEISYRLNI